MSALLRLLVEFDVERPATVGEPAPEIEAVSLPAEPDAEMEMPELDPGLLLLAPSPDPVAEAVAAALAEAEAAHAVALQEAAERHAAELADARARWAAEEAAPLAESFRQGMAALEESLAEAAGAALEPLVDEALRLVAVRDLRGAVADLVMAGLGGRIAVSGPADLVDALAAALAESGIDTGSMDFTPGETAEVSVTADNSAIETRLGAVTEALQRRLGERA